MGANGILVRQGATVVCGSCTVSGNGFSGVANGRDGIHVEESSSVAFAFGNYSVTDNAGAGISLNNLSGVSFNGSGSVTNNGGLKVACNPNYTTAAGLSNAGVVQSDPAQTNCAGP